MRKTRMAAGFIGNLDTERSISVSTPILTAEPISSTPIPQDGATLGYKQIPVFELDKIADLLNEHPGWEFVAFILSPSPVQAGWLLVKVAHAA